MNNLTKFSITTNFEKANIPEERCKKFHEAYTKQGDCWIWNRACFWDGYGAFSYKVNPIRAHRVSFAMHGGVTTPEKPLVLHSCGNKKCVNPAHLRAGTPKENAKDYRQSDAYVKPRAKLCAEDILEIRRLLSNGVMQKQVAKMFGVDARTISGIHTGISWSDIK